MCSEPGAIPVPGLCPPPVAGAELSLFDAESGDDGLPLASPPEAGLFGGRAPIHADGGAPRGMSGRAGKVKPHGGPLAAVGCSLRQAL